MITAKVYLIKTDTKTVCHCGHDIEAGGEYYMLRTDLPMWMSLCPQCVVLLSTPIRLTIGELTDIFNKNRKIPICIAPPEDVVSRRNKPPKGERKRKQKETVGKAEWV